MELRASDVVVNGVTYDCSIPMNDPRTTRLGCGSSLGTLSKEMVVKSQENSGEEEVCAWSSRNEMIVSDASFETVHSEGFSTNISHM